MAQAKRDSNHVPTLLGVSSDDGVTPQLIEVDPLTGRMLVTAVITSGSAAGTEYTDGDADATPTGSVAMGTDGSNVYAVATDASGHLQVDVLSGGGGGTQYTENDTDASITGTVAMMEVAGDAIEPLQGTVADGLLVNLGSNNDVTVTGTVTEANSNAIKTAVELIDNAISGNEMQVDVVAALPAGTNNIGDVDILSIAAGTNSIGNVGLVPRTSGGMTIFRSIDIDESEEEVKGSAGQVFSIAAFNRTAAPLYLKFYNATAANVTVGTTTPVLTFVVPGNADSDGAGFVWNNDIGFAFGTAISVACTTGVADSDTGAPGANDCIVNIGYA